MIGSRKKTLQSFRRLSDHTRLPFDVFAESGHSLLTGWLGLPPTGKKCRMKLPYFRRREDGLIRQNRVLVDMYRQREIDMFARLREFNKAHVPGQVTELGLN